MEKTPVYVVTGFLGSGKTTFIKRVIDEYSGKYKISVVQNEFAPSNFDGRELKRLTNAHFDMLEMNNGSVFCVCLLSGFVLSLKKFINEYNPELILLETSGLSDPIGVGELFNSPELQERLYLAGSICIVDGTSFLKLEKMQQRMIHQVQIADHVVVNKADLTDPTAILSKVETINPQSRKYIARYCDIPLDEIFSETAKVENLTRKFHEAGGSGRPDIKTAVFKTVRLLKAANLDRFTRAIGNNAIRMKGYLLLDDGNSVAVQGSMGVVKSELLKKPVRQTEIVVMGWELSPSDVRQIYSGFC
jgi:G3E family GTPase